ncbi:Mad3/BUB1 homology region 1-domain-containing protein [Gigaspora rosea]|uniref:Mad3/BUB1 homology region 1-domain-containing protein n=1 Tax=Gigaspora rosea TaxID=44941 RepID=A0A397V3E3_9GLOM|nr:Mad3/BUB1 homology region 1-domain-containing protein [Gigaspora rosea]
MDVYSLINHDQCKPSNSPPPRTYQPSTSQEQANCLPEFSSFEHQKENILPLKQGRSSASLSRVFSSDPYSLGIDLQAGHAQFKAELENLNELDDPFDVYHRYIKWTMENYPQGQTPQSNLIQLLERASLSFINDSRYKSDPRYLRCWLQYASFVGKTKQLFDFLKVNEIGLNLAAYYEEYAELLESMERYHDAEEIFMSGINQKAQPLERLIRRYKQFKARLNLSRQGNIHDLGSSQTVVPHIDNSHRTILGLKTSASSTQSTPLNVFNQRNSTLPSITGSITYQHGHFDKNSEKFSVFHDPNGELGNTALVSAGNTSSWNNYGTEIANKKENIRDAEKWKGITLPQARKPCVPTDSKLKIYHDELRNEKMFVDLNIIYVDGIEFSFEELRAMTLKRQSTIPCNYDNRMCVDNVENNINELVSMNQILNDEPDLKTISPKKLTKKPSPTINTKAALADIMEFFSQPMNYEKSDDDTDEDDMTSVSKYDKLFTRKTPMNNIINDENIAPSNYSDHHGNFRMVPFEILTPIQETSREYRSNSNISIFQSDGFITLDLGSVIETPKSKNIEQYGDSLFKKPLELFSVPSNPCNPLEIRLIDQILSSLNPSLLQYPGFYDMRGEYSNNHTKLERIARNWDKNCRRRTSNATNLDEPIRLFNDSFLIRQKIGEGAYGKVYRVLDMKFVTESHKDPRASHALKLQIPSTAWEFYIIRKLHERIISPAINSIITAHSLYYYKDESYLLTELCSHGTIVDAVNIAKRENSTMDEILVIFFTVELLKIVEAIHEAGIIHGDIKADNCLLRLERTVEWDAQYDPLGAGGWSKKGIKLIDFGRAIDATLFPPDMKFIADWYCDDQNCVEMREGRPWKWQADYYGLAGVIHCMLHNEYMQIAPIRMDVDSFSSGATISTKKYKPIQSFKRYWQGNLWGRLFDMLLNPSLVRSDGRLPITQELNNIRREFEEYLIANCEKIGKELKAQLKRLEVNCEINYHG